MQLVKKVYDWAARKALSPWAPLWLAFIFILEMFLFLPMDALLILFCMHNPQRRYMYAFVSTLSSVLIGLIGYAVGFLLWDSIGGFVTQYLISPSFFEQLVNNYNEYEYLAVFLGGFLPIPFKAITISAGFCHIPLTGYVIAIILSRALRFFILAEMMQHWGSRIRGFIERYFGHLLFAFGAKTALTFAFFWVLGN